MIRWFHEKILRHTRSERMSPRGGVRWTQCSCGTIWSVKS